MYSIPEPPSVIARKRKALMQRLAAAGHPPAAAAEGGRSFRGVGQGHVPRVSTTHATSVLASVLAKLGARGGSGEYSEVSPGSGVPIPGVERHPPTGLPILPPPIPTVPKPTPSGPDVRATSPVPTVAGTDYSAGGIPTGVPTSAPTGSPTSAGAPGSSGGFTVHPGVTIPTGGQPGLVPLGNGLFYDPVSDSVVGGGSSAAGGAAFAF